MPDWLLVPQMMSSTLRGVEVVALGDRREHGRREALRVDVGERALAGLADTARRAAGIDDQGFGHVWFPLGTVRMVLAGWLTNVRVSFSQEKTRLVTSTRRAVRSAPDAGTECPGTKRGAAATRARRSRHQRRNDGDQRRTGDGGRGSIGHGAGDRRTASRPRARRSPSSTGPAPRAPPSRRRSVATSSSATSPTSRALSRRSRRRSKRWVVSTSA